MLFTQAQAALLPWATVTVLLWLKVLLHHLFRSGGKGECVLMRAGHEPARGIGTSQMPSPHAKGARGSTFGPAC